MVHLILFFLFHYGLLLDTEYSFLCYIVGPCLSILLKNIFDVDLFYVFVEFVALLFLSYSGFWLRGKWDPSSLSRVQTHAACS